MSDNTLQQWHTAKPYHKVREDVALAVREARQSAGLTERELADRLGITRTKILRIEQGDNVNVGILAMVAHELGKKLKIEFVD